MNKNKPLIINTLGISDNPQGAEKYIRRLFIYMHSQGVYPYLASAKGQVFEFNGADFIEVYHYPVSKQSWLDFIGNKQQGWQQIFKLVQPSVVHLINANRIGTAPILLAKKLNIPIIISIVDQWWLCPNALLIDETNQICKGNQKFLKCTSCLIKKRFIFLPNRKLFIVDLISPLILAIFAVKERAIKSLLLWNQRKDLLEEALNSASSILFLSHETRKRYNQHFSLIGSIEQKVTPLSSELANIRLKERKKNDIIPTSVGFKIGFIGAIEPHKGLHILLDSIELLELNAISVELNIAGKFSNESYLNSMRNRKVFKEANYYGYLSSQALVQFYDNNDVIVIPSICLENQPQVLIDALALAKPTFVSNVPGMTELVTDVNFQFDMSSGHSLCEKLMSWLVKPTLVHQALDKSIPFEKATLATYHHLTPPTDPSV
jgi:glycosyltransferase involved in cell wall biosynthesis